MLQRFLCCLLLSALPLLSWSQENDTIQKKQFENFFGSPCDADTITETIGGYWTLSLYSNEGKLCLYKKEKLKWTVKIADLGVYDSFCLLVNDEIKGQRLTGNAIVFGYIKDVEEKRMIANLRNGRILNQ
jgi:hypothetical protein